jgi:hypothetical protein
VPRNSVLGQLSTFLDIPSQGRNQILKSGGAYLKKKFNLRVISKF